MKTDIVVISLESASKRRELFSAAAESSESVPTWRYFSAYTDLSPELSYESRSAIIAKGRPLVPRELACYSSHYAVWQEAFDSGLDQILVLEDDVTIDWKLVERLMSFDLSSAGVEFLRLYNLNPSRCRIIANGFCDRYLVEPLGFPLGTQAYILCRPALKRFLQHFQRVRRPVDDELARTWNHGVPCLALMPYPVFERWGESTIGQERFIKPSDNIDFRVERLISRTHDRLLRIRQNLTGFGLWSGPVPRLWTS